MSKFRVNDKNEGISMINEVKNWLDNLKIEELESAISDKLDKIINDERFAIRVLRWSFVF